MSLLDDAWRKTVSRFGGRPAVHVVADQKSWSFDEIEKEVGGHVPGPSRFMAGLAADPVDFIVSFLAARRAGKIFVALDGSPGASEVAAILGRFEPVPLPEGTAMIKITSGSTGEPRGVALSEDNLLSGMRNIVATMDLRAEDVNLGAISLAHSYGFDNLVLPLVVQGNALVLVSSLYPRGILDAISEHGVTFVPLVPFLYSSLLGLAGDWSSVRRCICAGALLDPGSAARFHKQTGLKIHTFYGATECGGITFDRTDDPLPPRGSVGTPLDGVEVEVIGEGPAHGQDAGHPSLEDLTSGRVRVRSGSVALGYVPAEESGSLREREFLTGDLGVLDPAGRLILTGRVGDLINVAGRKVSPSEIESCLLSMPGVSAAIVTAITDERRGEAIGALLVAPGLDASAIQSHCRSRLNEWKVPKIVRLVETLPHDERGKVSRRIVQEMLATAGD